MKRLSISAKIILCFLLVVASVLTTSCGFSKIGKKNSNNEQSTSEEDSNVERTDGTFIYFGSSIKAANKSISGDIVIPTSYNGKTIDTIPEKAFANCTEITSITVPNTITTIGAGAFTGCRSISEITLPFVGCKKGNNNNDNGEASFGYIFGGTSYDGGTRIKQHHNSAANMFVPDYNYFYIPSSLRKVTITNETVLGYAAFGDCSMLTEINLNKKLKEVGAYSFWNCSMIEKINLPNISTISYGLLSNCTALKEFTINDSIDKISGYAFYGCTALESINSTTSGEFVIPETITSIGEFAFSGCRLLKTITLPFVGNKKGISNDSDGKASFGYIFGTDSYEGGSKITQAYDDSSSTFNKNEHSFYIPSSLRTVNITSETILGYGAFHNCSIISSLNINYIDSNNIGKNAFKNCIEPTWNNGNNSSNNDSFFE